MTVWLYALVIFSWLSYIIGFTPLYTQLGQNAAFLAIIPVVLTAWLGKRTGGIIAALAASLVTVGLLYYQLNESIALVLAKPEQRGLELLLYVLAGFMSGYLSLLHHQLRAYKHLSSEAQYDSLTGLLNRATFEARLNHLIAISRDQEQALGVLFVDLDKFKYVNDTFGHDVGDELLRQVARVLKANVRQGDIVARLGGDEFMLVLTALKSSRAVEPIAAKILKALNSPFKILGRDVQIGGSIGISFYPDDGTVASALIKAADTAMYAVKHSGKNNYQLKTEETRNEQQNRQQFEKQLQLSFDQQQFELFYQPQLDLSSNKLRALEVLLRWRHPEKGLLPASVFLATAEGAGLLQPLGNWAMREACHQLQSWCKNGYAPARIAVNISAAQFQHPEFVTAVTSALSDYDLQGKWLELEIPESVLLADPKLTVQLLSTLTALDVKLTLDNFGRQLSSLPMLTEWPLSALKIDKSYTKQLRFEPPVVPKKQLVVESIVQLATKLERQVILEGIETREQHAAAVALGIHAAQGYYYAKPVAAKDVTRFLKRPTADDASKLAKTA